MQGDVAANDIRGPSSAKGNDHGDRALWIGGSCRVSGEQGRNAGAQEKAKTPEKTCAFHIETSKS